MKILLEHLKKNLEILNRTSELVGLAQHPVNIGGAREAIISGFLKQNLPDFIEYHTGELFDSEDHRSGQIDIILHPLTSPKLNLNGTINMFPVETVLACIEVKSSITGGETGSLKDALDTCQMAKRLSSINNKEMGYDGMIDLKSVPFIVFAFNSISANSLLDNIRNFVDAEKFEFQYLPDMIVVLNVKDKNSEPFYVYKTSRWMNAGCEFKDVFKVNSKAEVLLGPFEYILKNMEHWASNIQGKSMPIEHYTKNMYQNSLFRILDAKTKVAK